MSRTLASDAKWSYRSDPATNSETQTTPVASSGMLFSVSRKRMGSYCVVRKKKRVPRHCLLTHYALRTPSLKPRLHHPHLLPQPLRLEQAHEDDDGRAD